ncbi:MAG: Spy/CpxP family protein refolding chaperone [Phaeospirillum sp.]|nr:Spy/CpxP family protein refolding chaperone [Phaeospirillum sp.]
MKSFPRYTAAVLVALAVAGAFGVARANPMMGGGQMSSMCGDMDARMAGHMAFAETKLGLSASQKAEFKALTETMKSASEPMRKACVEQAAQPAAATMPSRMESMQKMMAVRTEAMGKMLPAMTKFYQSLTPEQQKAADTMMPGGMGGDRHGHHMMGH